MYTPENHSITIEKWGSLGSKLHGLINVMKSGIEALNNIQQSKTISNDQELIQSDPTFCPQNQNGNN